MDIECSLHRSRSKLPAPFEQFRQCPSQLFSWESCQYNFKVIFNSNLHQYDKLHSASFWKNLYSIFYASFKQSDTFIFNNFFYSNFYSPTMECWRATRLLRKHCHSITRIIFDDGIALSGHYDLKTTL